MRISSQNDMEVCGEAAAEDEAVELVKQLFQICLSLISRYKAETASN